MNVTCKCGAKYEAEIEERITRLREVTVEYMTWPACPKCHNYVISAEELLKQRGEHPDQQNWD